MDLDQVLSDIGNNQYLKAITDLSAMMGRWSGGECETSYKHYLMRSYCYQQLSTSESLSLAYDDILDGIKLAPNRFECYLQGALIYLDQHKFEHSYIMFKKAIEFNNALKDCLKSELHYVKFMALRNRGITEQIAIKYAHIYDTIAECVDAINNCTYKKINIMQFISDADHCEPNADKEQTNVQNVIHKTNIMTNNLSDYRNHSQLNARKVRSFSDVVKEILDKDNDNKAMNTWTQFSNVHNEPNNNCQIDSLTDDKISEDKLQIRKPKRPPGFESKPNCDYKTQNNLFVDNSFKTDSMDSWVNTNDWLCDDHYKTMHKIDDNDWNVSNLSTCDNAAKNCSDNDSTLNGSSSKRSVQSLKDCERNPTNLFKLNGVYISNIRKNVSKKQMKERFKVYGKIIDFYQPKDKGYAFIHFDNPKSSQKLIADYQGRGIDECRDNLKLCLSFTPTQDQMQHYNTLTYVQYKERVAKAGECDFWRAEGKCKFANKCFYKHIAINKRIDTLPNKRKANWIL